MEDPRESYLQRFKRRLVFNGLWLIITGIAATVRFRIDGWEKLLSGYRYLIHDRASVFSEDFRTILQVRVSPPYAYRRGAQI